MTYGALTTKAKALYGKRLRLADFEHMSAPSPGGPKRSPR